MQTNQVSSEPTPQFYRVVWYNYVRDELQYGQWWSFPFSLQEHEVVANHLESMINDWEDEPVWDIEVIYTKPPQF